jgi:hypothetical protein
MLADVRHDDRSLPQVLALILVMGLVGHLWMQTDHDLPRVDDHVHVVSAAHASTHHGGDDDPQPSHDHAAVCSALPSADHRVVSELSRCPAITPVMSQRTVGCLPLMSVDERSDNHGRSPRSPDHGVVLVL